MWVRKAPIHGAVKKLDRLIVPDEHVEFWLGRFPGKIDAETMRTMFALRSLAKQINDAASEWLKPYGLTAQKLNYLVVLYVGRKPMTFTEIRERIHTTGASVTGMIKALEVDGLVVRSDNPNDARSAFFEPTRKGRRLVETVFPVHEHYMERATAAIPKTQMTTLLSMLITIGAGIDALEIRRPAAKKS